MTNAEQLAETQQCLDNAVTAWCPPTFDHEPYQQRMMRALLNVNAYMLDVANCLAGKLPIRTEYPVPLPPVATVA